MNSEGIIVCDENKHALLQDDILINRNIFENFLISSWRKGVEHKLSTIFLNFLIGTQENKIRRWNIIAKYFSYLPRIDNNF